MARGRPGSTSPLLARALFFVVLYALMLSFAGYDWRPGRGLSPTIPRATNGDEPHYLVILNSLLSDHDLELANNYRRAARGGFDAGARFRGVAFDHHAMLVDERGVSREWHELYDWQQPVACPVGDGSDDDRCMGFAPRAEAHVEEHRYREVPAHPPAFAAILAVPLWLVGATSPEEVEPLAGHLLLIIAWLATIFTYCVARALGADERRALAVAVLLALASPWLHYARSFFTETMSGTFLILSLWALVRGRPRLAALLLWPAIAIKPLFVVVGIAWVVTRFFAGRRRDALSIAAILGAGSALLVAYDHHLARVALLPPAYLHDPRQLPFRWLYETLLGGAHGLLLFVPWLLPVGAALAARRAWGEPALRLLDLVAPLPLVMVVVAYQQGPHHCWGPRYWVPFLPWLAVAAAAALQLGGRRLAWAVVALAVVTASFTWPATLRFRDESLWEQPPYRVFVARDL